MITLRSSHWLGKDKKVRNINRKPRDMNSRRNCVNICIKIGGPKGEKKISREVNILRNNE